MSEKAMHYPPISHEMLVGKKQLSCKNSKYPRDLTYTIIDNILTWALKQQPVSDGIQVSELSWISNPFESSDDYGLRQHLTTPAWEVLSKNCPTKFLLNSWSSKHEIYKIFILSH